MGTDRLAALAEFHRVFGPLYRELHPATVRDRVAGLAWFQAGNPPGVTSLALTSVVPLIGPEASILWLLAGFTPVRAARMVRAGVSLGDASVLPHGKIHCAYAGCGSVVDDVPGRWCAARPGRGCLRAFCDAHLFPVVTAGNGSFLCESDL